MSRVKINENGCWLWTGALKKCAKDTHRYGWVGFKGKQIAAHRLSWMLFKGDLLSGMVVCHKCDVPSCVNPEHLFLGTQAENVKDMIAKGRKWIGTTIRKSDGMPANAKLSKQDVNEINVLRKEGETQLAIARKFGVSQGCISQLLRGVTSYAK